MTRILLVRHGNAEITSNGDGPLTAQGVHQSRCLGRWLARTGHHPDLMFTGPLARQVDTARHVIAAAREAGHGYPPATVFEDFAELSAVAMMQHALPLFLAQEPETRRKVERTADLGDAHDMPLSIVHLLLERWAEGRIDIRRWSRSSRSRHASGEASPRWRTRRAAKGARSS